MTDRYLTQEQVEERTGRTRMTLWRWRKEQKGPPWTDFMGRILYPAEDFEAWMSETLEPTSTEDTQQRGSK